MHSWQDRDGLLGDIHPRKDVGRLRDTWQSRGQDLRGQVTELEVHVILQRTTPPGCTQVAHGGGGGGGM